jgi:hypothetical protein
MRASRELLASIGAIFVLLVKPIDSLRPSDLSLATTGLPITDSFGRGRSVAENR